MAQRRLPEQISKRIMMRWIPKVEEWRKSTGEFAEVDTKRDEANESPGAAKMRNPLNI